MVAPECAIRAGSRSVALRPGAAVTSTSASFGRDRYRRCHYERILRVINAHRTTIAAPPAHGDAKHFRERGRRSAAGARAHAGVESRDRRAAGRDERPIAAAPASSTHATLGSTSAVARAAVSMSGNYVERDMRLEQCTVETAHRVKIFAVGMAPA